MSGMSSNIGSHDTKSEDRRDGYLEVNESDAVLASPRGHLRHVSETPLLFNEEEEEDYEEREQEQEHKTQRHQNVHKSDNATGIVMTEVLEFEEELKYPDGIWKTLLMFVWMCTGMVVTTIALIVTNERHKYTEPLPDLILDNIAYQPAGVSISEMVMVFTILMSFVTTMLHTHRSIILRRVFFIVGLMYFYRAITMSVTVLPKPDPKWDCPKQNTTLTGYDIWEKLKGVAFHGGISLGEKQLFCGDYIFSGHTMCLILSYLVVKEYGPPKLKILHWLSYALFMTGVGALLAGKGHYTIDVILGYWILTRVWAIYHGLVTTRGTDSSAEKYLRESVWWDRLLDFMEADIPGPLPARYSVPLPNLIKKSFGDVIKRMRNETSKEENNNAQNP